ncbi:MAG: PQQ-binding-like beta-propeller repeat protein [Candidatus Eremiobacterota bacterium]
MRILYLTIMLLVIFFLPPLCYSSEDSSAEEKFEEAHPVDIGNIKGTVLQILEAGKKVKVNIGEKDGLSIKNDKGKEFTVERQNIPVARLNLLDTGREESAAEVKEILPGITLKEGDVITSEINRLDKRDLSFLDSPFCELTAKTLITEGGEHYLWNIDLLSLYITGDSYLFTSYGNPYFGNVSGGDRPFWVGGGDRSLLYLFDNTGKKKWGFDTQICIYKDFNIDWGFFTRKLRFTEPDYTIYGDRLYLNGYNIRPDMWVPMKVVKASGIFFGLDLKTGKELWRLKEPADGYDPAFYGIIYDNFIDKICYLYSTEASLYAVDMKEGRFIWEFKMKGNGIEGGIFYEKDGFIYSSDSDGYFYKIDSKTGKEVRSVKLDGPVIKIERSEKDTEKIIYLFDSEKSVSALDEDSGSIIWKYKSDKIFTAPRLNHLSDNLIYTYDESSITVLARETGKIVWKNEKKFSSPVYFNPGDILYCVSDKRELCAINPLTGKIKWTLKTQEDIKETLLIKGAFYILDDRNIYAVDPVTGKEYWRKSDFLQPVYLKKYEPVIDPYNVIKTLGKIKDEENLIFIGGKKGYLCIDPSSHNIISEKAFDDEFVRAVGDPEHLYLVSKKHILSLDIKTGKEKWNRDFQEEIIFIAPPFGGGIYYDDEEFFNKKNTINSRSGKLLGLQCGETFYVLNKETGETVCEGQVSETVYPYVELQAMSKIGEKIEGVYFYGFRDCLYTVRGKSL